MKTKTKSILLIPLAITNLVVLLSLPTTALGTDETEQSDNEIMTGKAWGAWNKADYDQAIQKADLCIKEFRRTADALQKELKDKGEQDPPVGSVPDETQQKAIFNRGPLNDVATCYFLEGEAHSKLAEAADGDPKKQQLQQAKAAYESAATYTYARTWDSRGWFWDPSAKSNERLEDMPVITP